MDVAELSIPGAWLFTPRQHSDDRGLFLEWFKADVFTKAVGHGFTVAQANNSVSRRGVVRGIHFADVPPGQAKYVYCPRGGILDVVIDIRVGSPTFGAIDSVVLDDTNRRTVYLSEGLGHAFVALTDNASLTYLCSTPYTPGAEHTITPLDPDLGIDWRVDSPILSERDLEGPTLAEAAEQGLLPTYDDCIAFTRTLRTG